MQADSGYDTTHLHELRRALNALNESALADGLVAARDGIILTPRRPKRERPTPKRDPKSKETTDSTPAAAARVLALLRRREGDESPDVPGSDFTEAGVARLLARLRRRSTSGTGAWVRFLERSERQLGLPVAFGNRTIRGIGVERLVVFARQLEDIEAHGLTRFNKARAARRKVGATPPLTQNQDQTEPATTRRKGKTR